MKDMSVLFIVNGLLIVIILQRVFVCSRAWFYIKGLKRVGIVIDWWAILPLSDVAKRRIKKLGIYPEALDKSHLSKEDKLIFHLMWDIVMPIGCTVGILYDIRRWRFFSVAPGETSR